MRSIIQSGREEGGKKGVSYWNLWYITHWGKD